MSEDGDGFRSIFTGGWVLFAGLAAELLISLVGKVIIARYLGKVDYGGVALGATLLAMTATVVLAGIHTGVGRYLPRFDHESDRNGLVWSALIIVGSLSVLATGIGVLWADWIAVRVFDEPGLSNLLTVFALAVPAAAVMRLTIGISQGYQRSLPKVAIRNLTFPITRLLGVAAVVLVGAGSVAVAGAYLGAYVTAAVVGLIYLWKQTDFRLSIPETAHTQELVSFSAPLFLTGALSLILSDIDTLMLGFYASQADVGVYNVVYPTAVLLLAFLRSFRFIYMPRISQLDEAGEVDRISRNYALITKWLFLTTTPVLVVFIVYPRAVVGLLYGAEYASGGLALSVLAVGFYVHSVIGLNGTTLTSLGRTRTILYINIVAAVVNIGLNVVLIPEYALIGAAVATTVSYVLINVLYSSVLYWQTRIVPIRAPLLLFSVVTLVGVLILYYISEIASSPLSWLLYPVFLAIYAASYLSIVGVEDEEREVLREAIDRLGG